MAISKDITLENGCYIMVRKTLKNTGSHTEAAAFDVTYCVCDADDATYRKQHMLLHDVADPTSLTVAQLLDAIRDAIKTAQGIS